MKITLHYEIRQYGVMIYPDPTNQDSALRISGFQNCYFELTDSVLSRLQTKMALVAKLYKLVSLPTDCTMSMLALKSALHSIGATQVCRDERTGKLHTRDAMPDPDLVSYTDNVSYTDDSERMEMRYNRYHVLAIGPTSAQRLILADAAANGASDSWIEKFVSAGMPVTTAKYGNAPVWIDWQV